MAAMRSHLASCATHAAAAAELRAVADGLADTAEAMPPPPLLRARVLAAVAAEPRDTELRAQPRLVTPQGARNDAKVLLFPSRTWAAIAAVLVVAVGALLVWNAVLLNRGADPNANAFARRLTSVETLRSPDGAGGATVVVFGDQRKAVIVGDGMPRLDATKAYQAWAIRDGRPQ